MYNDDNIESQTHHLIVIAIRNFLLFLSEYVKEKTFTHLMV